MEIHLIEAFKAINGHSLYVPANRCAELIFVLMDRENQGTYEGVLEDDLKKSGKLQVLKEMGYEVFVRAAKSPLSSARSLDSGFSFLSV